MLIDIDQLTKSITRTGRVVIYSLPFLLMPLTLSAHEQCTVCHIHPSPDQQGAALAGSLPGLCIECHFDRTGNAEHAINIVPAGTVGNLPLVNGKLGCTTCHNPHGTTPKQLRVPGDRLCMSCHRF